MIGKQCRISIPVLLHLILSWSCGPLHAQEHSYVHYDVHDGLAGSTVYSMAQDKDGFIWFGTETGLSRFDGTHFRNFTTHDGLPDNEILKIFVDSRNRVWIIPFKNTIAYYYKGSFHTQQNDSLLRQLPITSTVESIQEDTAGNIVLEEAGTLHLIDRKEKLSLIKRDAPSFGALIQVGPTSKSAFRVLCAIRGGMMFADVVGTSLVPVRKIFTITMNSSLVSYIGPDLEICQYRDSIFFYYPEDHTRFLMRQPKGMISLSRINDSNVVLNTYSNNYLVDVRRKKITDSFLKGETVNAVMEDSEGNLWFSTLGRGVYRFGSSGVGNYSFTLRDNKVPVFSIREFDSSLYLGGDQFFLSTLNLRTGSVRSGAIHEDRTRGRIMDIVRKGNDTLLVGTDIGFVVFENFRQAQPIDSFHESVKSMQITKSSLLLVASNMFVLERRLTDMKKVDTIWMGRATCAYKALDSTYYIGTLNGLYSYRKGANHIYLGDRYKALANRIEAIGQYRDGTIWIATDGDGVVGLKNGRITAHLTESDGLTSNICRTILVAGDNIWAGTDKGLNKISPAGKGYTIIAYTMADGLNSDMINAIYVGGTDVYVGTSEGLTFFNEKKISKRSECLLRITGLQVSDRQLPLDSDGFVLSHTDNNIKFDFVGISYKSAGNIGYRYRLLGLDTGWKTTRETFLSYPSLPSGNYELQLMATNKFGIRSRTASLTFSVDKLLFERTWFRLLVLLSVAAGTMLYFNYRIRRVRKKETEKLETNTKMAELEQMALRSQMNPHFIFNCLNSIQQYVMYKDVLAANEFITKFSYLIRQTLDISTRPLISLHDEINYIDTYMALEKKRFDNKFIYEIVVDGDVDKFQCHIPPMILQPYIENAVRHGIGLRKDNRGRLVVGMQYRDDCLVCIIEDNGVGRKVAGMFKSVNSIAYQSVGMSLVAKRIEMLNKTGRSPVRILIEDLEDAGGTGLGTRINIFFPLEVALS